MGVARAGSIRGGCQSQFQEGNPLVTLDEQIRAYADLSARAADLRRGL